MLCVSNKLVWFCFYNLWIDRSEWSKFKQENQSDKISVDEDTVLEPYADKKEWIKLQTVYFLTTQLSHNNFESAVRYPNKLSLK